jgi:hypothetical protein
VIASVAVPALWLLARPVAVVVAAALYAHVGADLVADARREEAYVLERAAVLGAREGARRGRGGVAGAAGRDVGGGADADRDADGEGAGRGSGVGTRPPEE